MLSNITRRKFIKLAGAYAAAATLPGLVYPSRASAEKYPLEEILKPENYKKATAHWHPIFGPDVEMSKIYGGRADFKGHRSYFGVGGGAVDYYAHEGTPMVPPAAGIAKNNSYRSHRSGIGLEIWHEIGAAHADPGTIVSGFYHLYKILVDKSLLWNVDDWHNKGQKVSYLRRYEIFGLSGATGDGPFQGKQHPHAHWETIRREGLPNVPYIDFDHEKYGIDKEFRHVFWDGVTLLDYYPRYQYLVLKDTFARYAGMGLEGINGKGEQELFGRLTESAKLGLRREGKELDGKEILDSKYFIDMKDLIKDEVLRKEKYHPGTRAYTAMLELLGHGKDPNQDIIFTLPFISSNIVHLYTKPLGEKGVLRQIGGYFYHGDRSFRLGVNSKDPSISGPRVSEWREFHRVIHNSK